MAAKWAGRQVTTARAQWAGRLPLPCCRCGKPVIANKALLHDGWQVDHYPVPRELGGTQTWPAHALCNLSAGGQRGAEITNARRIPTKSMVERMKPERERRIRGR